jgi:hypothetical protein
MKLKIEIAMDNAAFDGELRAGELGRILVWLGEDISRGHALSESGDHETLQDINGNAVGKAKVSK